MKTHLFPCLVGIACLVSCDSSEKTSASSPPETKPSPPPLAHFLEAESCSVQGEISESPRASGTSFVKRQSGSYEPVLRCAIPVSEKPLNVWVRRNGGGTQMKISDGDGQIDGPWAYDQQEQFVWTSFGEVPPGGEGRELTFIGNNKENETVSIDCLLFTEGSVDDKDSYLTPLPPLAIDPARISGKFRTAPEVWGVNLFSAGDLETLEDAAYMENLAHLAPHLVRVHNAGKLSDSKENRHGFIDLKNKTWDEEKVRAVIAGLLDLREVGEIMINIPLWPDWMDEDKDGFLDEKRESEYASLVARFAEIAWEFPAARERMLFEITNERDNLYHADLVREKKKHRVSDLARIYLSAAQSIRRVAPGARIGGPSVANSYDMDFHELFIAITAPELDFYSTHIYISGDKRESDSHILARSDASYPLGKIREILDRNSTDRHIPLSLNEYNIAWGWEDREPRMTETFGAVWDASFIMSAFAAGADSAAAWNEGDGIYGKFSPDGKRRPSAHLYHVLNTKFTGPCGIVETEDPELITTLATESGNRLLLAHRGLRTRSITLPKGTWTGWILKSASETPVEISVSDETELPACSLLFLERGK